MRTFRLIAGGIAWLTVITPGFADIPKPSDVPPLVAKLNNGPAKVRAEAAKELGRIGQVKASYVKSAIPALLKAAKDKDDNVRKEALVALSTANPDPAEAVPVMIDGLKSKSDAVRIAAAEALGYVGSEAKDALPDLRKVRDEINKLDMDEKRKKRNVMQAVNQAMQSIQERPRKK